MAKVSKTHRFGTATIHDLEYIKKEMNMNETEAIDWALRMATTKIPTFRIESIYLRALDEMIKERGYKNRNEALKCAIIRSYRETHGDKDWDNLLKAEYHPDKSSD